MCDEGLIGASVSSGFLARMEVANDRDPED